MVRYPCDMRVHVSCEMHTVKHSSKDLEKGRDFQYLPHSPCLPLFFPLSLTFLVTSISISSCLKRGHLSLCFPFTYYYCFLKVVFLLLRLEFRFLLSQRLICLPEAELVGCSGRKDSGGKLCRESYVPVHIQASPTWEVSTVSDTERGVIVSATKKWQSVRKDKTNTVIGSLAVCGVFAVWQVLSSELEHSGGWNRSSGVIGTCIPVIHNKSGSRSRVETNEAGRQIESAGCCWGRMVGKRPSDVVPCEQRPAWD